MLARLRQMFFKEYIELVRDPKARFVLWGPALISMVLFGYAATFEIHNLPIAVLNLDHSYESRQFLARFSGSRYFDFRYHLDNRSQIKTLIDRGDIVMAIQIHPGFAELLRKRETAPVQVILDGSNSNTALIALGYVNQIASTFGAEYLRDRLERRDPLLVKTMPAVVLEKRPWYNSNLDSRWFFVPGLIGSLILTTVLQLTAFAVVRERELGTLEQIMVTPITRLEFILGKTVPFFLIGLADSLLVAVVGSLWFGVPFRGDAAVLSLGTALFLLSTLGVGLLISTASVTQQQAMVLGFFFVMPAITLSGFGTPVSSMPEVLQWVSAFDPLRHYLVVIRGVYLKGVGLDVLWPHMLAMTALGVVLLAISVLRFRKSLE